MALKRPAARQKPEPTIALINVVFLMLIFFMVTSTIAPPMDERVQLTSTSELEGRPPPDAVVLLPDGSMTWRGEPIDLAGAVARSAPVEDAAVPVAGEPPAMELRLVPDRDLPAQLLMERVAELTEAGAGQIFLVTERGLD
ncbi:ExbD/TolR family protein [Poseidonocella sedimentorum]|uniref:Biopolymer transport protein ExbD n=1 Tax=Poseidonocella sedimentorum TaxID=871652 RepID=A0A1I6E5B4_9RHOB|nr:biopolymer transporter ExbD [Poseidonocella sedimentorum]SFR12688.1 biopolymer transport protein ExbD [Poseidonocella sedimentorum]